jgi:hypothetical protein
METKQEESKQGMRRTKTRIMGGSIEFYQLLESATGEGRKMCVMSSGMIPTNLRMDAPAVDSTNVTRDVSV